MLYRILLEQLRARAMSGMFEEISKPAWEAAAEDLEGLKRLHVARALVWTATRAQTRPDHFLGDIDLAVAEDVLQAPAGVDDTVVNKAWFGMAGRSMLVDAGLWPVGGDSPVPHRRHAVRVPIAFDHAATGDGRLAWFELQVLDCGSGTVSQHPQDALTTWVEREFVDSVEHAWAAARELIRSSAGRVEPVDGRWRVLPWNARGGLAATPEPVAAYEGALKGPSSSGAAARGWWLALQDLYEDPGIICLCEAFANGTLGKVGSIGRKVSAIASDEWFDTIVVATADNAKEVQASLPAGKKGRIRIELVSDTADATARA